MKRLGDLIRLLGFIALGVALYQELRKPPEERTWHGEVAGFVPYEFRAPTWERVKSRLWNPEDRRIIMPILFGVGWTVNFAALYDWLQTYSAGVRESQAE